ncbi:MAG: hypothetical protein JW730_01440, partial [Anaerolineales bacterium]|nr:hypothetical protein [Anaerolineales bacterium]
MKRILSVLIVLLFGMLDLACAGQGIGVSERPSQVYDQNGVTFKYPQNWEVISPRQLSVYVTDYTYLAVLADKDDRVGTAARFVIVQTDKAFNDYMVEQRDYYQKRDQFSEKAITVNGTPAMQFESSGSSQGGEKRKSINIYFEYNDQVYYLAFSTLLEKYDRAKPDIDMIVNSFKMTGINLGASPEPLLPQQAAGYGTRERI